MSRISLAHGNGGRFMRELIAEVFQQCLANPYLDIATDAAHLGALPGELMMTVDGFTVKPLEFPGGNIGSLAIHGTINDLAVSGALPKFLSLSVIIEEGLETAVLQRIIATAGEAAAHAGVQITCGDTKVVPRGEGSGLYLTTTGIGVRAPDIDLHLKHIQPGDHILVSGPVGDHGTAVLLAREQFGLSGELQSDAGSVLPLCQSLLDLPGLRFMRDPTRGGLATVMHEICRGTGMGVILQQQHLPVRDTVTAVCEMLGYDPLYLACEGRVVAVMAPDDATEALQRWRRMPEGADASIVGEVSVSDPGRVILETELGGQRLLEELEDSPLPRIC